LTNDRLYLLHIQERIARIREYAADGWEAFRSDRMKFDAIVRNFEIIGEAAKRLSPEVTMRTAATPWRRIAGFRDVLIHRYDVVDPVEVWRIVEIELPLLAEAVDRLLHEETPR
jgi:uncharacterized protein with HEPN domain